MALGKAHTLTLFAALLLASCAPSGEESGQNGAEEIDANVEVFGGRERFILKWSGLPSGAESVSLVSSSGKT